VARAPSSAGRASHALATRASTVANSSPDEALRLPGQLLDGSAESLGPLASEPEQVLSTSHGTARTKCRRTSRRKSHIGVKTESSSGGVSKTG